MSNSAVFEEFVRVAKEKGLISEAEAEHTEQNTKNPRWDSLDTDAIAALYGVKPDLPKGMEYEHNIMEDAHPNAVVIAPSYDKLNGLVENDNERQNILLHIVYKQPEIGTPNQFRYPPKPALLWPNTLGNVPKYAQKDLLLSLVRVANDMDNKDQDQLRLLADACLSQLHTDGFQKQAFIPWVIAAAVILSVVYLQQHLSDVDQGIKENYTRLQSELQDFLTADVTVGFGHKYDDALKQQVLQLQSQLSEFWSAYANAMPLLLELEKPRNASDLVQQSQTERGQEIVQAYEVLRSEVSKLYPYLDKIDQNFNNPDFKAEHTAEKGAFTSWMESVPFLHGGKASLTADDFDDVVNAISPFKASVQRLLTVLAQAGQHKDAIQEDVGASVAKTQQELGPDQLQPETPAAPNKSVQDIDQEASGLSKALEGFRGMIPSVPGLGE